MLDVDVLVAVLRGEPEVLRRLRGLRDVPLTSAVAAEAVLTAARPDERTAVEALLAWLHVVPVGLAEARRCAAWRAARPGLERDTGLTAACAAERGVPLVMPGRPGCASLGGLDELRLVRWER